MAPITRHERFQHVRDQRSRMHGLAMKCVQPNSRISDTRIGERSPAEDQAACAGGGEASGCTAKRRPIALRIAVKLLRAGLPFDDRVR